MLMARSINDLLPRVGGGWTTAAAAGVFNVRLFSTSGLSNNTGGARAVRLLAA